MGIKVGKLTRMENEEALNELHALKREIALEPPTLDGLDRAIHRFYEIRDSLLAKVTDADLRKKLTWGISMAVFMEAIRREAPLEVCKKYLDAFAASGFGSDSKRYDYHEIYAVRCEEVGRNDEALTQLKCLKEEIEARMKYPMEEKQHIRLSEYRDRIDSKISALESC